MEKKNYLTLKIVLATFISIAGAIFLYGIFVPLIVLYTKEQTIHFIKKLVVNVFTLGPLSTYFVYLIYKPAEKVIKKIDNNITLSDSEIKKGIRSIDKIPPFLFIIGSFSYLIGVTINYLPLFLKGIAIDSQELTFRLLIAICWGIINGFITARILNWFLIEAKVKFKIFTINQNETRTTTILKRLFFPIAALLSFPIIINILLFISYSSKNLLKESINNIVLINIMLFFLICLIAFIIIFESLSYLKNLLLQLNHMIREELNLSDKVILTNFDDIGLITSKINVLIDRLFSTFVKIKQLTMQVSQSGNLMHGTINKSHERAVEIESNILLTEKEIKIQITNIENMVSSVNSIIQITKTSIDKNNNQASKIETTSNSLKTMITSFENVLNLTISVDKEFNKLQDAFQKSNYNISMATNSISEISETGKKVQNIVKIISDIADRTNLLSMNASIEAAHAGEQGKGFAVVASEIRKLSQNTASSAKMISSLIDEISDKIINGEEIFKDLSSTFTAMHEKTNSITTMITGISAQSTKQIESARENIAKIDDLLNASIDIKKDTITQHNQIEQLKQSIDIINADTRKISDNEHNKTEGIKELIESFLQIKENSKTSFDDINKLESAIAQYKI
ncbi:MAG: hypothetical protein A2015_04785 [Spirochaetes bacterium GWF1_31_7]|nr:MAG: hypothetical protein A2Y30_05165 [Spirochaetes bacterium GWE1_32_154]OHD48783.1 MAG: hypothetical protein A2Y29_03140 [Spirochaetes bacterium GWE2_31_10]OHD52846.1 MAG: hypothetical protein A2015_04785 [Spirochaetes bacterium GWF1_31_7]HBD95174.1 hypothetical protein [Spirochaetia bacterium]HBI37538.1 hypothetical protein [Spirochaetia bacterium]